MADRVHPMPAPPLPSSSPPPGRDAATAAAATGTMPLHPSFRGAPPPSPSTYIIQIPKDQVLRVPPPDRAARKPPPAPPRVLCRLQRVPPPGPPRRRPVARVPPGAEERDGVLDGVDRRRRELHGGVEEAARSARCP
uniref:Uncharacterized protein n=1 Tax=Oryza glaberrima TaxID=4538 RepID=I1QEV5_ORYGL